MAHPIIGVTANSTHADSQRSATYVISQTYIQSILNAGGVPVIIPPALHGDALRTLVTRFDGILLTGGSDIDPARFNGVPHPGVYGIDPDRDEQEIQIVREAAETGKPFMGICRGIQSINVALGGTLFTDIGDQLTGALRHDWYPDIPRDHQPHTVTIDPRSRLAAIVGCENLAVNSLHHQGIEKIAPSLKPAAYAPDGLIEAVELVDHPFGLGVQWHPECLPQHEEHRAIFRAFIAAAEK